MTPDARRSYALPARLARDQWALAGEWTIGPQPVTLHAPGGRIAYRFHARDVHLVMGPAARGASVRFRVTIDGRPPGADHGIDVDEKGDGAVNEHRLYQLVRQRGPIADRLVELVFLDPAVQAFAVTFG